MQYFINLLITCSISMSVLILIYIITTPWLSKKYDAKWIYYAWLVIIVGLIIPFRVNFNTAIFTIDPIPVATKVQQGITITRTVAEPNASLYTYSDMLYPKTTTINWSAIVAFIWIVGALLFVTSKIFKHYKFIKMANRWSEQVKDPQLLSLLHNIKQDMAISKNIEIQICSCITSPMMIGFVKPVILLPVANFSLDELQLILRHELVHFKRKDLWYKCLVFMATAIHWFNPVVYLMAKAIADQCEISCDAEVVKGSNLLNRQQYSETIIGVIKNQSKMQTVFATNFYGGIKGMKKRIFSIMDITKKKCGAIVLVMILIGTMATGSVFAVSEKAVNTANKSVQFAEKNGLATDLYNTDVSQVIISIDDGDTFMYNQDPKRARTIPNIVWWTYDEYKTWLKQEKINLQQIIGEKGWNPTEGWYVWTQQRVDKALQRYEKTLQDIKVGIKVSKTVNGKQNIAMVSTPINKAKITTAPSYIITVVDEKGNEKVFGPCESEQDLLDTVKSYYHRQIADGTIAQSEADKIIKKITK
ncbi:M56 family metallopeptidase [Clostridium sp. 'deep sea']|uniref:M56 family metallopeptidase n=1 Tax=Clostridium sp. 'deep sea' TaxID=2779445 RepID=UPI0018969CDA|nr:M56 family metallopeptidase [Clostridium sp. 'deep sea']QOR34865.1 M56 family metallopeptidase [Clostridium sp. 'deep sea']